MNIFSDELRLEVFWQFKRAISKVKRAWYVLTTTKAQRETNRIASQERFTKMMRDTLSDSDRKKRLADAITAQNSLLRKLNASR